MAFLNKSNLVLFIVGMIGSIFCTQAYYSQPHDFSNYYFGAYFYSQGDFGSWIYFPHLFNEAIAAEGYENIFVSYAPNTPFLAQFFLLFSWMSLTTAKLVFNLLSLVLFLYSLRKLMSITTVNPLYFALIPVLFFVPLHNNFLFGQVYLLLFFLLVEGWLAYRNESFWKMGVFWALAIGLKLSPIFIVGWLVVQMKWKPLIYLAGTGIGLFIVSVLWSGWEVWEFFLQKVLAKSGAGEITTEYVQNYQSFHMLLKGLLMDRPQLFAALVLGYKLILLGIAFVVTRQEKNELKLIGVWLMTGILISPYGSTYSLLFLIVVALYFSSKLGNRLNVNWIAIGLLFFVDNLAVQYFSALPIPFNFPRLVFLLFVFGFLIFKSINRMSLVKMFGVILVLILLKSTLFPAKIANSDPFLIENQPILVYDYGVDKGKLVYTFWTDRGAQSQATTISVNSLKAASFNSEQLAARGGINFYKASILNDTSLIYLSDEKRGIGFYALHIRAISKP